MIYALVFFAGMVVGGLMGFAVAIGLIFGPGNKAAIIDRIVELERKRD